MSSDSYSTDSLASQFHEESSGFSMSVGLSASYGGVGMST